MSSMPEEKKLPKSGFVVRSATEADLPQLARIHKQAYSSAHFTALLPLEVLSTYYGYFLGGGAEIMVVVSGERIDGFAVFGENIPARIVAFKKDCAMQIFIASLRHPITAASKVIERLASGFQRGDQVEPAAFLLLSIAVVKPRMGIGAELLSILKCRAASRGHSKVGLYVNSGNFRAINAYFGSGFVLRSMISNQYYMESVANDC